MEVKDANTVSLGAGGESEYVFWASFTSHFESQAPPHPASHTTFSRKIEVTPPQMLVLKIQIFTELHTITNKSDHHSRQLGLHLSRCHLEMVAGALF